MVDLPVFNMSCMPGDFWRGLVWFVRHGERQEERRRDEEGNGAVAWPSGTFQGQTACTAYLHPGDNAAADKVARTFDR